ncbi:Sensor histidine kinase VraS [Streptococcus mitis]|uniref:Sensor histidine kinase VraS n=1 Tax=Streptococcus mitis TaxID=28037 RepID=A0A150NKJ4_STRMT|nr:Sensor histidine kinase VraS [Streptococcus mitis]
MKKQAYVIIALTSFLFVLFFSHSLLEILDFDWSIFLHDVEKNRKICLFVVGIQHVHDLSLSPVLERC